MWLLFLSFLLFPVYCDRVEIRNLSKPMEIGRSYFFTGIVGDAEGNMHDTTLRISFMTGADGDCPLHLKYYLKDAKNQPYVQCYHMKDNVWTMGLASYREGMPPKTKFNIVIRLASATSIEIFKDKIYQPEISSCISTAEDVKWLQQSVQTEKRGRYWEHVSTMGEYGGFYQLPYSQAFNMNPEQIGWPRHVLGYLRHDHTSDFWLSLHFIDKNDNEAFKIRFSLKADGKVEVTSGSFYSSISDTNQDPLEMTKGSLFSRHFKYEKRDKHHVFLFQYSLVGFTKMAEYHADIVTVKVLSNGIDIHEIVM